MKRSFFTSFFAFQKRDDISRGMNNQRPRNISFLSPKKSLFHHKQKKSAEKDVCLLEISVRSIGLSSNFEGDFEMLRARAY